MAAVSVRKAGYQLRTYYPLDTTADDKHSVSLGLHRRRAIVWRPDQLVDLVWVTPQDGTTGISVCSTARAHVLATGHYSDVVQYPPSSISSVRRKVKIYRILAATRSSLDVIFFTCANPACAETGATGNMRSELVQSTCTDREIGRYRRKKKT
jgi:hypothetical protein